LPVIKYIRQMRLIALKCLIHHITGNSFTLKRIFQIKYNFLSKYADDECISERIYFWLDRKEPLECQTLTDERVKCAVCYEKILI
jgi:hypothetical protein